MDLDATITKIGKRLDDLHTRVDDLASIPKQDITAVVDDVSDLRQKLNDEITALHQRLDDLVAMAKSAKPTKPTK